MFWWSFEMFFQAWEYPDEHHAVPGVILLKKIIRGIRSWLTYHLVSGSQQVMWAYVAIVTSYWILVAVHNFSFQFDRLVMDSSKRYLHQAIKLVWVNGN